MPVSVCILSLLSSKSFLQMLLCKKFRNSFVSLLESIPLIMSANFSSFPPLNNSNSNGTISLGEIAVRVSERLAKSGVTSARLFC